MTKNDKYMVKKNRIPDGYFYKDEKGSFDGAPKMMTADKQNELWFFDVVSAGEVVKLDLDDLIIERLFLKLLYRSKYLKEQQIIDVLMLDPLEENM